MALVLACSSADLIETPFLRLASSASRPTFGGLDDQILSRCHPPSTRVQAPFRVDGGRHCETISSDRLELDRHAGRFLVDGERFTGEAVYTDPDGHLVERAAFRDGRRHGWRRHFFADGQLRQETPYVDGRREGRTRSWWSNGVLRSEGWLRNDRPHGHHLQWYASGALFKSMNLVDGAEVGLQQAWRENGKIYNNYEAKNGRIYGLRRSKLCFQLSAEEVALAD